MTRDTRELIQTRWFRHALLDSDDKEEQTTFSGVKNRNAFAACNAFSLSPIFGGPIPFHFEE